MSDAEAGYEHFDVEADVGVHGWGPTRADAFAQAALGALALAVHPEGVASGETRDVRAQGDALEMLLVNLVNECLYVHEIEGFAVARVEVQFDGEGVAHARLHGEPIDPARHRLGTVVKAATLHRVSVDETAGRHETRLIVDV